MWADLGASPSTLAAVEDTAWRGQPVKPAEIKNFHKTGLAHPPE